MRRRLTPAESRERNKRFLIWLTGIGFVGALFVLMFVKKDDQNNEGIMMLIGQLGGIFLLQNNDYFKSHQNSTNGDKSK